jgi:hypothetical protein
MEIVAIIPVYLLKEVLRFGRGGFDEVLCKKFGYIRQMRMTGAVVSRSDVQNVSVGSTKPNAFVGYSFTPRSKQFEYTEGKFYVLPA